MHVTFRSVGRSLSPSPESATKGWGFSKKNFENHQEENFYKNMVTFCGAYRQATSYIDYGMHGCMPSLISLIIVELYRAESSILPLLFSLLALKNSCISACSSIKIQTYVLWWEHYLGLMNSYFLYNFIVYIFLYNKQKHKSRYQFFFRIKSYWRIGKKREQKKYEKMNWQHYSILFHYTFLIKRTDEASLANQKTIHI